MQEKGSGPTATATTSSRTDWRYAAFPPEDIWRDVSQICGGDPLLEQRLGLNPRDVRPDAAILGYPVITAGRFAHRNSFRRLTGTDGLHGMALAENFRGVPASVAARAGAWLRLSAAWLNDL